MKYVKKEEFMSMM